MEWLFKLLPMSFIRKAVGSIIRHGLTALAGFLAAQELVSPEILEQFVNSAGAVLSALVVFLIGLVLSLKEKVNMRRGDWKR